MFYVSILISILLWTEDVIDKTFNKSMATEFTTDFQPYKAIHFVRDTNKGAI